MSDLKKYEGVIPAFYACYDEQGEVSPERTRALVQYFIDKEMRYLHEIMQGAPVSEEFAKLLTGEAALEAIATADACTQSMFEDRKVKLSEVVK